MAGCDGGPVPAGLALAGAAQQLVGSPFRLHGRDKETGLDCVGLLLTALGQLGRRVELGFDYRLKGRLQAGMAEAARRAGFELVTDGPAGVPGSDKAASDVLAGDVMLIAVGPCQLHLAIAASDGGVIHAHAGLRAVVHQPEWPAGQIIFHWRLLNF